METYKKILLPIAVYMRGIRNFLFLEIQRFYGAGMVYYRRDFVRTCSASVFCVGRIQDSCVLGYKTTKMETAF